MGRSENMYGRVRRRLKVGGVSLPEIYESLQLAQQDLVLRVNPLTEDVAITTVEDQADYTIQANVRSIKAITKPDGDGWDDEVKYILPKNWDEITRLELSGEPQFWMFNDNMTKLSLHPAPTTSGETITLQCYLKDSTTKIAAGVEPEIESYWDRAMVFFALAEHEDTQNWLALYEKQIEDLRHIPTQSTLEPKVKQANW